MKLNHRSTMRCILVIAAIVSATRGAARAEDRPATDAETLKRRAEAFARDLAAGRHDEARKQLDETMLKSMSPESLAGLWANIERQAGAFKSFGSADYRHEGQFDMVYVESRFTHTNLRLKIVFNPDGRIGGLWVQPGAASASQPAEGNTKDRRPGAYAPPKYDKPDRYDSEFVSYGLQEWKINGVLTTPKGDGPFPAVLLVHGSGPHDEDETIGPNKPFKDLACGLSSRGIAVLRYQKRTHAHRTRLAAIGRISIREEVIDDALEGFRFLRTRPRIDPARLFVVGHSLGATLAPQIGQEDGKLAGVVLLAGTARDLTDVLIDQLDYIAALPLPNQHDNQKFYDEALETIGKYRNGELGDDATILNVPMAYWKELGEAAEQSVGYARMLKCPILIAAGGRDYQVTRKDFDIYQRSLGSMDNVNFQWFEDSNHLFFRGKGMGVPTEYSRPGHVDRKLVDFLVHWITKAKGDNAER